MAAKKFLTIPAAGARKGLPITYTVQIGDKEIITGGTVIKAEKTGENEITVTIEHYKTGDIHTNTLQGNRKIAVHMIALVNQGLSGTLTLWPTAHQHQHTKVAAWAQLDKFTTDTVGTSY